MLYRARDEMKLWRATGRVVFLAKEKALPGGSPMDKIEFTTTEREALQYWRFHHPHPRVQRKMEALYLKSQGLAPEDIGRLCAISKTTFYRYLHAYRTGGIDKLQEVSLPRRQWQVDIASSPLQYWCGSQSTDSAADARTPRGVFRCRLCGTRGGSGRRSFWKWCTGEQCLQAPVLDSSGRAPPF